MNDDGWWIGTTKSRIVFKQQNHGEFDTVNYMDFELPSNLEAIILDERILISDHCIAGGANDPIAFEIRNLTVWIWIDRMMY